MGLYGEITAAENEWDGASFCMSSKPMSDVLQGSSFTTIYVSPPIPNAQAPYGKYRLNESVLECCQYPICFFRTISADARYWQSVHARQRREETAGLCTVLDFVSLEHLTWSRKQSISLLCHIDISITRQPQDKAFFATPQVMTYHKA